MFVCYYIATFNIIELSDMLSVMMFTSLSWGFVLLLFMLLSDIQTITSKTNVYFTFVSATGIVISVLFILSYISKETLYMSVAISMLFFLLGALVLSLISLKETRTIKELSSYKEKIDTTIAEF